MSGKEVLNQGFNLARECLLLTEASKKDDFIAIWGGEGILSTPSESFLHKITVDFKYIPEIFEFKHYTKYGLTSIYTNEEDCRSGIAVLDHSVDLRKKSLNGIKLCGCIKKILPPIDAVLRFGTFEKYPSKDEIETYEEVFQKQYPLFNDEIYAMISGWHFPWPDGDWVNLVNDQLILCTFKDAEPWVEVWDKGSNGLEVIQRIT